MKSIILGLALSSINLIPGSTIYYQQQADRVVVVDAEVSAYTSSVGETDDTPHTTASGTETRHGVLACPSRMKFGTRVEIESKLYVCEDRMGKRYADQEVYDIWMPSKELAREWGRRNLKIKILL